jgi:uridylate kinase
MDTTAFTLSQENKLPIVVFDMNKIGNLLKICEGENIGTVVNIYRMVRLFDSLISDNTKI